MDYKKKYEALVGQINKAYLYAQTDSTKAVLEDILSELRESENERIRKALLESFEYQIKESHPDKEWVCGIKLKEIVAWLEKQRSPKPFDEETACSLAKEYRAYCQEIGIKDPDTLNEIEDAYCYGLTHDFYWQNEKSQRMVSAEAKEAGYGKVEQKPTDNVEPKYKVGNWYQCTKDFFGKGVTFDKNTAYYCAKEGCLQDEYGCHIAIVKDLYDNFKLWAIEDAKDGDVLVEDSCIFVIQKLGDNSTAAKTYFTLYNDGDFDDGSILYFDIDSTKPATKEQRDLLFQKMKEEGYEWDAEKKELRKIHVIDEGKAEMDYCFTKMMNGEKVSSAWSEEDEYLLGETIQHLEELIRIEKVKHCGIDVQYYQRDIDWLKSLKYRVQLQTKQEWSEDDVNRFRNLIYLVEHSNEGSGTKRGFIEFINRLKDGVQRQWKPSDEQLDASHDAAHADDGE